MRTVEHTATTRTALGPLEQIEAGVLNVGYAEAGPSGGPTVILLHGWPYDIHSYVDVIPLLTSAGYHVIAPYLRGYGTTTFLSNETFRNGQPSALALDAIALMDVLKIDSAILAGFDWGGANCRHRRGALATTMQGARIRERLPDRQPGRQQEAAAADRRAAVGVPVLLRYRTRGARIPPVHPGLQQADLAACIT